ncbi:MAG: stage 0 sporulation family protein [Candidatus Contubernalis sp.]|nr:stage 0 sporulation family protein [Candidatus Contubernalis sp.]
MPDVVGVRFKKAGKIYYFDPENEDIKREDFVIVETSRGVEFGEVVVGRKDVKEEELVLPLKRVIRIATVKDHQQVRENREKEDESFEICLDKISDHGLDMKLIDVEYTFDRNKIIFYFTADGRIDFRELVKDLAAVFRTRIELRQIGVRDEAKMMGGLGPCGRMLCCSIFLGDFEPVSIRMAKDQNLSLNPTKISGICSRLMCCLRFESDAYKDAKEICPRMGNEVITPEGEGRVVKVNMMKKSIAVELFESHKVLDFPLEEVIEKTVNQKLPKKNEGLSD